MVTMLGCESLPAAEASRANRSLSSASSRAQVNWPAWMILTATGRPMAGSNPWNTTPMAPRPNSSIIWYGPIVCIVMTLYLNVLKRLPVDVGVFAVFAVDRSVVRRLITSGPNSARAHLGTGYGRARFSGYVLKTPLAVNTKGGVRFSRARDISIEVWRPKNVRKERMFGSFDTTKTDGRGERQRQAIRVIGRAPRPNLPQGSLVRYSDPAATQCGTTRCSGWCGGVWNQIGRASCRER